MRDRVAAKSFWRPRLAVIEEDALSFEIGMRVLEALRSLSVETFIVDSGSRPPWDLFGDLSEVKARSYLLVQAKSHRKVRPEEFPSIVTRRGHYFVTLGANCPYRCEYCYLYANSARIFPTVISVDLEDTLDQIREVIRSRPDQELVFNIGEDHDSLALEHLTGMARDLVSFFSDSQTSARLEMRTKAPLVESLLGGNSRKKTTIGLSVSPAEVASTQEHLTAPVHERLAAGKFYRHAGFEIALKFEPGIIALGWKSRYLDLIDSAYEALGDSPPEHASLGCFRYRRELSSAIARNFPANNLSAEADVEYVAGRYSYSEELRREFYTFMIEQLRRKWPALPVYLSMESEEMCSLFGASPWVPSGFGRDLSARDHREEGSLSLC